LDEVLQRETKKAQEEEGLLPIPKDYLPWCLGARHFVVEKMLRWNKCPQR
jgi:hypothetical protein